MFVHVHINIVFFCLLNNIFAVFVVKSMNRQLIAVFNFLVTVGGAFAFGYKGVEVAFGSKMFPLVICQSLNLMFF